MNYALTCAFTGHREIPNPKDLKIKLLKVLESLYFEYDVRYFVAGGALGFDTLAAEAVLELREMYSDISLEIAVPCENQTKGWTADDKKKYEEILSRANTVTLVSKTYFSGCMHKRNRYMIDKSDICISYLSKDTGGTAYTVKYAKSKGVKTLNLYNM